MPTNEQIGLIIVVAVVLFFLVKIVIPAIRETTREGKRRAQLLAIGATAKATILDIRQLPTSSQSQTVLVELEVQVEPSAGEPFSAVLKQAIPTVELAQMPRGGTILVRYNSANLQEVAFFGNLGHLPTVVQPNDYDPKEAETLVVNWQILDHDLMRLGNTAPAEITAVSKTGITLYNGAADVVRFTLRVRPPGQGSFTAESVQFIKKASEQKFKVGTAVTAYYNPNQLEKVTFQQPETAL